MLQILHVEDDPLSADWLAERLNEAFADARIDLIKTEAGFRAELPRIVRTPPNIVIMDVMLRWTDPSPQMIPRPPEVEREGVFRAGLRCCKLLTDNGVRVPVLFYTVLERNDLEKDLAGLIGEHSYLPKSVDPQPLISKVRRLVHR